ncbi:MAG TPA: hypothetical protein VHU87_01075 [Rhizomicrobium sp.]|jgi:hypothetical protein|nr:hypothetical protein [Rhizomicrobium sp.]
MTRLALAAVFALSAASAAAATPDAQDMAQVVNGFYTVHQSSTQDGIPNAKLRAQYAPYISPALEKLLIAAGEAETQYAKNNRDAPPLVEGDLFSPNFEGISSFKLGACVTDAKGGHCALAAHYAAHPRPQDMPLDWTDTVWLVKTPAGWRVDDIAYGGNWDFGNHGKLSETLESAVNDAGGAP